MRPSCRVAARFLVLIVSLSGCGTPAAKSRSDAAPVPADAAPAAAEPVVDVSRGRCDVSIGGDLVLRATSGGGPSAVATDYWQSPEELDAAMAAMSAMLQDKKKQAAARARMELADPKIVLLLVACRSDDVQLTFGPGAGSRYADVPFAPGRYLLRARNDGPGEFGATLRLHQQPYRVDGEGDFVITRFDKQRIVGTFRFAAERKDDKTQAISRITVQGAFDYPCSLDSSVCREGRAAP